MANDKSLKLTSGKLIVIYLVAFFLVLIHEADRFSGWLEDLGGEEPGQVASLGRSFAPKVKLLAEAVGIERLNSLESSFLSALTPSAVVGSKSDNDSLTENQAQDLAANSDLNFEASKAAAAVYPLKGPLPAKTEAILNDEAPKANNNVANLAISPPPPSTIDKANTNSQLDLNPNGQSPTASAEPSTISTENNGPDNPQFDLAKLKAPETKRVTNLLTGESSIGSSQEAQPAEGSPEAIENEKNKNFKVPEKIVKVLLTGDSMMLEGLGPPLQKRLKNISLDVVRAGKYATGLSRPDVLDWPKYFEELIAKENPQLVFFTIGANDTQDIIDDKKKRHILLSDSWKELYAQRVALILSSVREKNVLIYWIGLPTMGKEPYNQRTQGLNLIVETQCQRFVNCRFWNSTKSLLDKSGHYSTYLSDGQGRHVRVRAKDNIHLTEKGGQLMLEDFWPLILAWDPLKEFKDLEIAAKNHSESLRAATSVSPLIPALRPGLTKGAGAKAVNSRPYPSPSSLVSAPINAPTNQAPNQASSLSVTAPPIEPEPNNQAPTPQGPNQTSDAELSSTPNKTPAPKLSPPAGEATTPEPDLLLNNKLLNPISSSGSQILSTQNSLIESLNQGLAQNGLDNNTLNNEATLLDQAPGHHLDNLNLDETTNGFKLFELSLNSASRGLTKYLVVAPAAAQTGQKDNPLPAVLLLHGAEGNYETFKNNLGSHLLIEASKNSLILIMPDGTPFGWYLDSPLKPHSQIASYIINELLPDVLTKFPVDPHRIGILGTSMGGHGALTLTLNNPNRFKAISLLSAIIDLESHRGSAPLDRYLRLKDVLGPADSSLEIWQANSAYFLTRTKAQNLRGIKMRLTVGLADKLCLAENRQYDRLLTELNIEHEYLEESGGHGWALWKTDFTDHLKFLATNL
ncbi:MAG: DUF459 domain-containing protein [Deltaproteobacteria bacterium]|jgi:S-formylglutathione hydrolase FrmB|nr:DUF459 domain-containing protein [Deltaproteobacteria bacterium]